VEYAVRTPDGRVLAVEESGDPAGRPVLVHTGTPGSRHLYGPVVRDAAARGLRLISYDRPGYGGSSPRPGRTVASCVGDVDRLFFTDEAAARAKTDKDREEILTTPPEDAAKAIESLLTPTDAAALRGDLADYLISAERDALAPGSQGWWDDNCMLRPWGFDLADIAIPVLLLHGRQDMFVPVGHGEWLAAHIPGVEARLLDNDGHLTLLRDRVPEVHAWLSERL